MRIKWTEDKINFIVEQYTSKQMNSKQLAKYFGCSDDTILRRLKEQGIVPHKFYEDLTGRRFGKLTVLKKSDKSQRRLYWVCQCDCGNIITTKGDTLKQGLQKSCGCTSIRSKTENAIAELLTQNNVLFVPQYSFEDLLGDYGTKLRFDFGIIENNKLSYLIEYDGEQHYESKVNNNGWNTQANFEKVKVRDNKKNIYCKQNNIPLIRIPYWHKHKIIIEDLKLETSQFII